MEVPYILILFKGEIPNFYNDQMGDFLHFIMVQNVGSSLLIKNIKGATKRGTSLFVMVWMNISSSHRPSMM